MNNLTFPCYYEHMRCIYMITSFNSYIKAFNYRFEAGVTSEVIISPAEIMERGHQVNRADFDKAFDTAYNRLVGISLKSAMTSNEPHY